MITPSFVFHSLFLLLCLVGGVWALGMQKRNDSFQRKLLPLLLRHATPSLWVQGLAALEQILGDHLHRKVYIEDPGLPHDKVTQDKLLRPFFELLALPSQHAQTGLPAGSTLRWQYKGDQWILL